MKFHGLVLLAVLGLSEIASAQNKSVPADSSFLPPSPRKLDGPSVEPQPLPPAIVEPNSTTNIETELRQFRNELREFQALREEVSRSTKATDAAADQVSIQQRQELMDLLTKLAKKNFTRKAAAAPAPVEVLEPVAPPVPTAPLVTFPIESSNPAASVDIADPFALGKVLFRTGDFVGAEKAFRKTVASSENEMTLKYLVATCQRRQSKWPQAVEAYKAIAESNQDPVLRDLAKWQLDNIRWHQQSETQLEQMRQQREKRQDPTNGQSASLGSAK